MSDADESGQDLPPIGIRSMTERLCPRRPRRSRPVPEMMEARRLLASLASIANLSVPAQQGYTLPLDGSGSADVQNYSITRTSGSSDITASIPQGPFWTINVQYTDPTNSANNFSGPLVFQLFQNLAPNTVGQFEQFTSDGYFTGKPFTRVVPGFVVQGGAPDTYGTQPSNQPGTPYLNELAQPLAFTGTYQLAMANAGVNTSLPNASQGVNTDDTQFFITDSSSPSSSLNSSLSYGYTIFGQMLAGQATLAKMTQVPVGSNPYLNENSHPNNPLVMSSVSFSTTNPSGVALIDTTQARPGDSATFQVTATDPTDGTSVSRTFTVTAGTYSGPNDPAVDFKPLANPGTATVAEGDSTTITVTGQDGYPDPAGPGTLTYSLVTPPSHGTVSNFNASTGTFVYTPQPNYAGPDSVQFTVQDDGPTPPIGSSQGRELFGPATITTSAPATVAINVTPTTPTPTTPAPTPTTPAPTPTTPAPTPTTPTPTPTTPTPTTPAPTPTPTTPTPTPPAVTGTQDVKNRKHQVTAINLTFSGTVDPAAAANKANYQLIKQGKHGTFIATRTSTIKIKSASFNPSNDMVTLIPKKPFALSKPVEVLIVSGPQSGLHHTLARPLVNPGWPAPYPAAILSRSGATTAVASTPAAIATADAVDVLLAQSDSDGLVHTRATAWQRKGR